MTKAKSKNKLNSIDLATERLQYQKRREERIANSTKITPQAVLNVALELFKIDSEITGRELSQYIVTAYHSLAEAERLIGLGLTRVQTCV